MKQICDRRKFLCTLATSGTLLAGARWAKGVALPSAIRGSEYGGLKMGVQSYCFHELSLERTVELVQGLGLHYIEVFPGHLPYDTPCRQEITDLKRRLADNDINVPSYGVVSFRENTRPWEKIFEFAKALGIETISSDPAPDAFDDLDRLVEKFKINVGVHSHWSIEKHESPRDVWRAIRDRHPRIGATIDTGNILSYGYDPVDTIRLFRGRIYGIHLKDISKPGKSCVLGRGRVDIPAVLRELHSTRFGHIVAIEYEEEPENPIASIKASLEFVKANSPNSSHPR